MAKLIKDPSEPYLYRHPQTGRYYFRRYVTEAGGEIYKSLKETNRHRAIQRKNALLSNLTQARRKQDTRLIDEIILELYNVYQAKAKASFENFEHYCRTYIAPYFSGMPIDQVPKHWDAFKTDVHRQRPGMSLVHLKKHMTRILSYSHEQGYIPGVPKLRLDPGEKISTQPRAYEPPEVSRVLHGKLPKMDKRQLKPDTVEKIRLMLSLTLYGGLRPPSEVRNLRVDDIDFSTLTIRVRPVSKTRTERTVTIPKGVAIQLKNWISSRKNASDFVFPHSRNPNLPATRSDKSWQRLKKALGISGKLYWFRHSHATAAIEGGVPALVVAKTMGTSLQMLDRVYVRPKQETSKQYAKAVSLKYGRGREKFGKVEKHHD